MNTVLLKFQKQHNKNFLIILMGFDWALLLSFYLEDILITNLFVDRKTTFRVIVCNDLEKILINYKNMKSQF